MLTNDCVLSFINICLTLLNHQLFCLAITPTSLLRLDISPYNTLDLSCTLSVPVDSTVDYPFSWTEQSVDVPAETSLSITSASLASNNSAVTSVLSVMLRAVSPGTTPTYTYKCEAGVFGSNKATVSAVVFVRGTCMHVYVL